MKFDGIYGVYTITCTINNKILVGEGKINVRLGNHKSYLKSNRHANKHLQSAYNLYGEKHFLFEILEECNQEYCKSQENYWCNMLDTHNREVGYNIQSTNHNKAIFKHSSTTIENLKEKGRNRIISKETREKLRITSTGRKLTDDVKKYLSKIKKGKLFTKEHIENIRKTVQQRALKTSKPIIQISTNGDFIKEWKSISICAKTLKISSGQICDVLKGNRHSAKGYIFCYKDEYFPGALHTRPIFKVDRRKVIQLSINSTFIKEWASLSDASEFLTGNRKRGSDIGACCRGIKKTALGYKWKYKNERV